MISINRVSFILAVVCISLLTTACIYKTESNLLKQEIENNSKNQLTKIELDGIIKEENTRKNTKEVIDLHNKITAKVTAYAPSDNKSGICSDGNPDVTSTGYTPSRGIVAVDPSRIAYGTRMYIPGYGEAIANDTGGALRDYNGYAIDVYFPTHQEAMNWGVRHVEVKLLK